MSVRAGPSLVGAVRTPLESHASADTLAAYDLHRSAVYGFALTIVRDASTAEDLLQDAFLRLLEQHTLGRPPDEPLPWLFRVVANLAVSRGRRLQVATRMLPRLMDAGQRDSAESHVLRHEYDQRLVAALATLSLPERTAIVLAAAGFHGEQIARAIGRSDAATRTMLCRARVRLQRQLDLEGLGDA